MIEDFKGIVKMLVPGAGACGGMYTANTMAAAIEALGMSLALFFFQSCIERRKKKECLRCR